jgi:hypothetical protein
MSESARVPCPHCGGRVAIPSGHTRAKIRCGECGYYAEVPPNLRSEAADEPDDLPVIAPDAPDPVRARRRPRDDEDDDAPRPPPVPRSKPKKPPAKAVARENPNPRDNRPEFVIPDGADLGPDLLEGNQIEHDDQAIPYRVPGDGTMTCRECNFKLPLGSQFCVHCGLDFATKKKPKKRYEPIDREWEPRMNLTLRLQIFAGLQVLNVLVVVLLKDNVSVVGAMVGLIFQGGLQAFLIGSFEKIAVRRTGKGAASLTKTWRICFIPSRPIEIDWKKSHALGSINTHSIGFLEWLTFFYLLLLFVVPGIVFYFLVIHPMRYQVVLCDVYGSVDDVIFRTTSEEQPDEICRVVSTATGLMYRSTM